MWSHAKGLASKCTKHPTWVWLLVGVVLVAIGCSKPLYVRLSQDRQMRWQQVMQIEAQKQEAADRLAVKAKLDREQAIDFGRQLDSLTAFYETVITLLLGALAVVTALAVWTIKVVSKSQAEETARAAVIEILGGHDDFRQRLAKEVEVQLEFALDVVREQFASGGVPEDSVVTNPQARKEKGPKPHVVLRTRNPK
ncbi:hypothetical protein bcgnr5380_57930 [Bacillus cereus]|uniref:Lipoprotein n=2 Tax=Lysobacter enzymogenes TaxID=69 RepID=A0AAU9AES0_LYSEN|nr:hypothetical protein LEN_1160 [Lysobacter enzymogenes]